jgi:hypothetical protein
VAAYMYPLMQELQQAHRPRCNLRIGIPAAPGLAKGTKPRKGIELVCFLACWEAGLLGLGHFHFALPVSEF